MLARAYMRRERPDYSLAGDRPRERVLSASVADPRRRLAESRRLLRLVGAPDAANPRGLRSFASGTANAAAVPRHVTLDDQRLAVEPGRDLVALDDALTALAAIDERKSQVVEMRFFGGLTNEEAADILGVSAKTVTREWQLAKVWLLRELI